MSAEVPELRARYVKREAPDKGRVVTVTRIWEADDGHTAVACEWYEKPKDRGKVYSACPLDVFERTYRPEGAGARDRLWALYQTPDTASAFGEALDAYAHELAEKIRSQDPVEAALAGQDAWRIAADLIDPEVSNDG